MNKLLVAFAIIIAIASAKLYVYHPYKLREKIDKSHGEIKSSLANFGLVHYGHSIIGRVWYDDANKDGCNKFNFEVDGTGDPDTDPSPIVLVWRGNCPFTTKVRNVEHAGGRLAIVIDNKNTENPEEVIMVDDGSGSGIRIPSILISERDGETILDFMEDDEGLHTSPKVALMAKFELDKPDNRVEWDFWYTSSSGQALNFLRDYREYNKKLGDKTLFTPHFSFWSCRDCDKEMIRSNCFGNGEYCALDERNLQFSGQEILYEDLRQKCLFDKLTKDGQVDRWWDYVETVHSNCYNGVNKECSVNAHKELGLDFDETDSCVDRSFDRGDHSTSKNRLLDEEHDYWSSYGPHYFPAAVINNITYRGTLQPANVFEAICEGFKDKPKECGGKGITTTIIEGINTSTLLMIIIALVVINVGIIVCYKRYAKREMDEKIEMHINSAVSQYFALQDKNSKEKRPMIH